MAAYKILRKHAYTEISPQMKTGTGMPNC